MENFKDDVPAYYNCGEQGHINTHCHKSKKPQAGSKVFALAGSQPTSAYQLIRGTCYIYGTPLIAIIDTSQPTRLFVLIV